MPVSQTLADRFAEGVAAYDPADGPVVLAVSGGSDSTALMHLVAAQLPADCLVVVSVHHGLRQEADAEIALVAAQAEALGLRHEVQHWAWDQTGNLQAAARAGRWALLRDYAQSVGAQAVWMGHTEDDQIETVLMRLARGSGVDGLTGMAPLSRRDGVLIARPLLGMTRADLREWLKEQALSWSDDPSNTDPRYARVKVRQMYAQLQDLGLTPKRLLQTVEHMQAAQATLIAAAKDFATRHVVQEGADLVLDGAVLDLAAGDTPRRVLTAALAWVNGANYRPRFDALRQAAAEACAGQTVTLAGVIWLQEKDGRVRLIREAAATATSPLSPRTDGQDRTLIWDSRWTISGPSGTGLQVRALADGLQSCPQWRETGVPRRSLMASPAIWDKETLVAAPVAGLANGWSARIVADFHSTAFAIED
ncbi:tRNA lysidine(34) synthetase TilS [Yoonia litorea]|uniref:tRNA(Ile)-lysidine synthase n=1 Tax=Yoonia litorea TaxID=1123755 RepID=A0A1I6N1Y2_9RHOB|nr:tRNA lysidine(34) synthetase TilS [Yoonia litorea]SFS21972.1 tRNA(Ile)-lysidine synthase [Yoonia litorea]